MDFTNFNVKCYNGICIQDSDIGIFPPWNEKKEQIKQGTLIQVRPSTSEYCVIQIYSIQNNELKFKENFYNIHQDNIVKVPDELFPYLVAIKNLQARATIIRNKIFVNFLIKLSVDLVVTVSGKILREKNDLNCVVKYIGTVPEYGPGKYIGVMILNSKNLLSKLNMTISRLYLNNSPNADIILTADKILPITNEDDELYNLHLIDDSRELMTLFDPITTNRNDDILGRLNDVNFDNSLSHQPLSQQCSENSLMDFDNHDNFPTENIGWNPSVSYTNKSPTVVLSPIPKSTLVDETPDDIIKNLELQILERQKFLASKVKSVQPVQPTYIPVKSIGFSNPNNNNSAQSFPVQNRNSLNPFELNRTTASSVIPHESAKVQQLEKQLNELQEYLKNNLQNQLATPATPENSIERLEAEINRMKQQVSMKSWRNNDNGISSEQNNNADEKKIQMNQSREQIIEQLSSYQQHQKSQYQNLRHNNQSRNRYNNNMNDRRQQEAQRSEVGIQRNNPPSSSSNLGAIPKRPKIPELTGIEFHYTTAEEYCLLCFLVLEPDTGVTLNECDHTFCIPCLVKTVGEAKPKTRIICPYSNKNKKCTNFLKYQGKVNIRPATKPNNNDSNPRRQQQQQQQQFNNNDDELKCDNIVRCSECDEIGGYIEPGEKSDFFVCPKCGQYNCLLCKAIHSGMTCIEFKNKQKEGSVGKSQLNMRNNNTIGHKWSCESCTYENKNSDNSCYVCNGRRPNHFMNNNNNNQQKKWICDYCTLENIGTSGICSACARTNINLNVAKNLPPGTIIHDTKNKDWICNNCLIVNSHCNQKCDSCKTPKPKLNQNEIKKSTSEVKETISRETKEQSPGGNCSCCNAKLTPNNNFLVDECYHVFCKNCLLEAINNTVRGSVICPLILDDDKCKVVLKDRLIKLILSKEKYEMYERRLLQEAAGAIEGSFLCKKSKCMGWWIVDDNDEATMYSCPICNEFNCLTCEAIHTGMSCKEYKDRKDGKIPDDDGPKVQQYYALLQLEDNEVVTNTEEFECEICYEVYEAGEGITLRDCFHVLCRNCLSGTITNCEEAEVRCPMPECKNILQEREIRAVITAEDYEKFLKKSLQLGQQKIDNGYQCKTPDCVGWWINDENINELQCPICNAPNCLQCQAIHPNMKCQEYQDKLFAQNDPAAQATKKMFEDMIKSGEGMHCPGCNIIIARKAGCDWLKCTMCQTEICWVTKGPRWGKKGPGDLSGGCRCRANGPLCHPNCGNCH